MANGIIDKEGKDVPCPIDEKGCYLPEIKDFVGQYVKVGDKRCCSDKGIF
jgi:isoleucyl-tRNA synthetase